jgi:hypothetical protein
VTNTAQGLGKNNDVDLQRLVETYSHVLGLPPWWRTPVVVPGRARRWIEGQACRGIA